MQDYPVSFLRLHGDWMGVFRVTHSDSSFLLSPPLFFPFSLSTSVLQYPVERNVLNQEIKCAWRLDIQKIHWVSVKTWNSSVHQNFWRLLLDLFLTPQNAPLHILPNIFTCTTKGFVSGDGTVRNMKQNQSCWVAQASKSSLGGSSECVMLVHQQKQLTFSFQFLPTTLFVLVQLYQREVRGWNKSRELSL